MIRALYAGSFDPVTKGHLDIVDRAACLFDELVIGIYERPQKGLLFTTEERLQMMKQAIAQYPNVRVEAYNCLTIDFAHRINAKVIIRGLRMSSDFEREFEMALMNKKIAPDIESAFLMSSLQYQFLSSSLLKEVAMLGGDIDNLVPEHVKEALKRKLALRPQTQG
ncbi:MAG TPA: pantetheine-phosphate adenylyltransferase [Dehalococcoidia bacterium]|nr:pantetheine-phosphate adenylyltransferase [Dehalococcoidia bacterium]